MERMGLNAKKRGIGKGVSRKLRRGGDVPAILYGAGRDPVAISVDMKELEKAVGTEAGWNVLLDLNIDDDEKVIARISDYQAHVLTRNLTHVDFQEIDITKKIKVEVPIRLVGKAEGVKKGGILEQNRRFVEVKCMPTNIPEHIDIDVTNLDIGQNVHISDVPMPEGVECLAESNFAVATIVEPTEELVAEAPAGEGAVEGEAAVPAEGEAVEGEAVAPDAEGAEAKPDDRRKEAKKAPKE